MQGLRSDKCTVVKYILPFGATSFSLSDVEWKAALFSRQLPYSGQKPFNLNRSNKEAREDADFQALAEELEKRVIEFQSMDYESGPIALFALAPQPLLIKLGFLLGDETDLMVFQRSRTSAGWNAVDDAKATSFERKMTGGKEGASEAILILSVSGQVNRQSLPLEEKFQELPTYEIIASDPGVNAADSSKSLEQFKTDSAEMIYQIHEENPYVRRLHIFPAMPSSLNVMLGATLNTSVIPQYLIYEKRDGRFSEALTIGAL